MLINTSTSITLAFTTFFSIATAALSVYLSPIDIPKKKVYFALLIVAVFSAVLIFVCRFWSSVWMGVMGTLSAIERTLQEKLYHTDECVLTFPDNIGIYIIGFFRIFPWIPFFFGLNCHGKKMNVFTTYGRVLFFCILPIITIIVESKIIQWLYIYICSINRSVDIFGIILAVLLIHVILLKFIYRKIKWLFSQE